MVASCSLRNLVEISSTATRDTSDEPGLSNASFKEFINSRQLLTANQLTNRQTTHKDGNAMKHRNVAQAAVQNAQAIDWAKTHTLQDLEDLANEMSSLGEDVMDIKQLLDDLCNIEKSMQADIDAVPEAREYAEV